MKAHLYLIYCITDLQCGKEKENYEPIDLLVQRDSSTGLPCINGSSLHGALREFIFNNWVEQLGQSTRSYDDATDDILDWLKLFGKESSETNNLDYYLRKNDLNLSNNNRKKLIRSLHDLYPSGSIDSMSANLLCLTLQSSNYLSTHSTSNGILNRLQKKLQLFKFPDNEFTKLINELNTIKSQLPVVLDNSGPISAGSVQKEFQNYDFDSDTIELLSKYLGNHISYIDDSEMTIQCDDFRLPNQPRNVLENGESKNVWFEQFIPSESSFYTFIFTPEDGLSKRFHNTLDESVIQIGANATVGMGYVSFRKIDIDDK